MESGKSPEILNSNGDPLDSEGAHSTNRSIERIQEDQAYLPVIIKRSDQGVRHPDDTLESVIGEGLEQIERSDASLLLSATAAGLILGFTAMAVGSMGTILSGWENPGLTRLGMAIVYPLGFVVVILSGTQLFTEHTATAVYPVLDGRASFKQLLRLWFFVLLGNLLGAFAGSLLLYMAEPVIHAKPGYEVIAKHLFEFDSQAILFSSILAGWLMALGGWLVLAVTSNSAQILCIFTVTFLIGLGGLHHSIAGSVEALIAVFLLSKYTILHAVKFVSTAVAGNLIGGSVFVAVLNYAHIRKTQTL